MIDLAALVEHPERVADVPPAALPALVLRLATEQKRLAAVGDAIAARLATVPPATSPEPTSAPTLDVRAAARLLDLSPTTLRRLVANDQIPHLRLGRRLLFRRATLERFAADRERFGGERS